MTSGDPKYHSGRKKKEYASPYLEFLAKITTNARRSITSSTPSTPTGVNAGRKVQRGAG